MKDSLSYTDRIAHALLSALLADEKEQAPSYPKGDQGVWSIRSYREGWLQYVLMKATNGETEFSLNFEDELGGTKKFADVTAYDVKGTPLCCVEIKGPNGSDSTTRRRILDDVKKQRSRNLANCELSVFALVHGEETEVDRFQEELKDDIGGIERFSTSTVSSAGDIKLNKGLDGTPYGVLRILVVRVSN